MRTNNTFDITKYSFRPDDRLFLDANVWLAIEGPLGLCDERQTRTYSVAYKAMLEARCKLYLDILVLSEFVNRYARFLCHVIFPDYEPTKFKQYRRSPAFGAAATEIADAVRRMLSVTEQLSTGFEMCDAEEILLRYEMDSHDFNDLLIAELCRRYRLTLVTDDSDFRAQDDLRVLTSNRFLLN